MPIRTWNTPRNRRYVARFLIIGGCATAVDLTAYLLLTQSAGLAPAAAKTCSYLIGMAPGFLGNKFWTFGSKRHSLSEPAIYATLYGTTLAVNVSLNSAALSVLGHALPMKLIAFVSATSVTTLLNFLGLRLIAFRHGIREAEATTVFTASSPAHDAA